MPTRLTILAALALAAFAALVALPAGPYKSVPPKFDQPREITIPAEGTDLNALRVATWNIEHGAHLKTIGGDLEHNPTDLLLLQEVDWNAARSGQADVALALARQLRLNGAFAIEFEELSQEQGQPAFTGQATLTRLPIRNSRVLRFHSQSGFWQPRSWVPSSVPLLQRRLGNRVALITELTFAGKLLLVYNVHFESRSYGRIQSQQLDEILADSARYPAGTCIVLGGDLNTKYLPSIFLHKLEHAGFRSSLGERIERTHVIAMALDWIFAKGHVQLKEGKVRHDFGGSDHYPIYASLYPE